jgi:hypothetical protein
MASRLDRDTRSGGDSEWAMFVAATPIAADRLIANAFVAPRRSL